MTSGAVPVCYFSVLGLPRKIGFSGKTVQECAKPASHHVTSVGSTGYQDIDSIENSSKFAGCVPYLSAA